VKASLLLLLSVTLVLTGCAVHQSPYIAKSAHGVPLKDTAVLVALDDKHLRNVSGASPTIRGINGENLLLCTHGCPYWVRVPAGRNSFAISYVTDIRLGDGFKVAILDVAAEMQAKHVYVVRYERAGDHVGATIEDLGENADYGVYLGGLYGDGKTVHRARFD
jgi:hypothetical protein